MAIPPAGAHGGDAIAVARSLGVDPGELLDLSQSLNPFAIDAAEVVIRHRDAVRRYPDPTDAHAALSDVLGVEPGRLLLTNGGSEAIALVAATVGGHPWSEPEFGLHPRHPPGPIWRSDPHNPSGALAAADDAAGVWDEAFYPLATGRWTSGRPGTVVGSLTKVFACPGLRIGYVIDDDIERFTVDRAHWAVNSLALAALPDLLASADLGRWRSEIAAARHDLGALFTGLGHEIRASDAPWILVRWPGLRERLAPHGVIVRDCASFGMAEWMRVAVPDAAGRGRLADALERIA